MHSHDRTLLASLAFGDKDKTNSLHGLACRYLTEPEQALRLLDVWEPTVEGWVDHQERWRENEVTQREWARFVDPSPKFVNRSLEHPISKGQGQYMTTIGFLDAVANYEWEWTRINNGEMDAVPWGPTKEKKRVGDLRVLIEVKIHPVDVDEVLRQIRLYQQYVGITIATVASKPFGGISQKPYCGSQQFWILAVRFDISQHYCSALEEHGIKVVQLGIRFDEWVATLKSAGARAVDEI